MERLTRDYTVACFDTWELCGLDKVCTRSCKGCDLPKKLHKLSEYENAEEQGLLVRLPIAIGTEVFTIGKVRSFCSVHNEQFDEYNCQGCDEECDSKVNYFIQPYTYRTLNGIVCDLERIGETIFLTKSEALQALKERE